LTRSYDLFACSEEALPEYESDPTVERVAKLTHTITPADLEKLETKDRDGVTLRKLNYMREIHLGTKEGTLLFKAVSPKDGKEWGRTEVEYGSCRKQETAVVDVPTLVRKRRPAKRVSDAYDSAGTD